MDRMEPAFVPRLPPPGHIVTHDCRKRTYAPWTPRSLGRPVRAVQWNVERNYKADLILETLARLEADIIVLQEVDILCERSDSRDHFRELCQHLNMLGAFVTEFEELAHPSRAANNQGGGVHGNAILTRFDATFRSLPMDHPAMDWALEGAQLREPRKGMRCTLVADIDVPGFVVPVVVYSVHLEVYCGLSGRVAEFSTVMHDTHQRLQERPHQLIFGDLNTMAHSIARLSPHYCRDAFRFLSFPMSESEFWHKYVFGFHTLHGMRNTRLPYVGGLFSETVRRRCRNPGFWDPWDVNRDVTLHSYLGIYSAKLDWTLVRGMEVVGKWVGNKDYRASDHRLLMLELRAEAEWEGKQPKESHLEVWERRRKGAYSSDGHAWVRWMLVAAGVSVVAFSFARKM